MRHVQKLRKNPDLVSTLLLARRHHGKLRRRISRHGGLNGYLVFLLKRFGRVATEYRARRERTEYQADNLDLVPVKFRPSNIVWIQLGLLARKAGVSRCVMFVFLFLCDERANAARVVTTFFPRPFAQIIYTEVFDPIRMFWSRYLSREKPG